MSLDEDTLRKRILARGFTEEEMRDTLQKCLELNLIMRSGNIVTRLNYGYFGATIPAAAYFYAIGYYYGLLCVWLLLWIIMHLVITMDLLNYGTVDYMAVYQYW